MKRYYHGYPHIRVKAETLLADIHTEFGWKTRLIAPLVGRYVFRKRKKAEEQLAAGRSYEPHSFCEKNAAAAALERGGATPHAMDNNHIRLAVEPSGWKLIASGIRKNRQPTGAR